MSLTFQYEKRSSQILGAVYRPVARTFFFSKVKNEWYGVWMLVDSGADYTILPGYLAENKEVLESSRFGIWGNFN